MDMLMQCSFLKQYWGIHCAFVGGAFAVNLLTGSYTAKNSNHRDADEKIGIFQFRRKTPIYLTTGLLSIGWVGWNFVSVNVWGGEMNDYLSRLLEFVTNPTQSSGIGASRLCLAAGLFGFHIIKRLHETFAIQIRSHKQVLNPLRALLNLAYYPMAVLTLFAECFPPHQQPFSLQDLRLTDAIATGLFFVAQYVTLRTYKQLAQLRRNRFGHVTSTSYKMPTGSMFSLVSCPHYLAEVVIYSSLAAILGCDARSWLCLLGYVCSSQLYLAHSTHAFYMRKFEDYPPQRYRLIPYVF